MIGFDVNWFARQAGLKVQNSWPGTDMALTRLTCHMVGLGKVTWLDYDAAGREALEPNTCKEFIRNERPWIL